MCSSKNTSLSADTIKNILLILIKTEKSLIKLITTTKTCCVVWMHPFPQLLNAVDNSKTLHERKGEYRDNLEVELSS